jgi:salicylate hydroxylase
VQLFEKHNPAANAPSTAILDAIFTELERVRIPRTSEIVRLARAQGELRVTEGVEQCIARNNYFRELCKDSNGYAHRFGA